MQKKEMKDLERKIVPESLRSKAGFAKRHNRPMELKHQLEEMENKKK